MKNDRHPSMNAMTTINMKRWWGRWTLWKWWPTMAARWNEYNGLQLRQDHVKHGRLTKKHRWADGYSKQKMMTEPNPMGCHLATILSTSLQADAFNNWNNISKITHVFLDTVCIYARTGALRKARLWATNSGTGWQHPRMGKPLLEYFCQPSLERKNKDNCLWQLTIFGDIICPTS